MVFKGLVLWLYSKQSFVLGACQGPFHLLEPKNRAPRSDSDREGVTGPVGVSKTF